MNIQKSLCKPPARVCIGGEQTHSKIEEVLFVAAYQKYRDFAFSLACSLIKDKSASDDIVHDVFLNLWSRKELLHKIKDMGAYLSISIRNRCIDKIRRRKIAYEISKDDDKEPSFDLLHFLNQKEDQRLLQLAYQSLSPQRKKVFVLGWLEGWSREEIAEYLKISPFTVKNLMTQARRDIAAYVTKHDGELRKRSLLRKMKANWQPGMIGQRVA